MTAKTDSLEIGVLVYPGAQHAAVQGVTDLFTVANRVAAELGEHQLPLLRVSHWQLDAVGQPQVIQDGLPQQAHAPRVMLIPPSLGAAPTSEMLAAHRRLLCDLHGQGVVLASVCVGVFLIAGSGLLDGRAACSHWNYAQALSERFPKVRVATSQPLLDDGDIVTSAGLMAWTDLGLHLIERFVGHTLARETARYLAVTPAPAPLPGALFTPKLEHGDEAVLRVQHWLQGEEARTAGLADMARCAGLEPRTFLRRFRAATGLRPTEYAQQVRVGRACRLLEFTRRSVDQIAWGVGYQDPGAFRKVFQRFTGMTPSDYRRRFAVGGG